MSTTHTSQGSPGIPADGSAMTLDEFGRRYRLSRRAVERVVASGDLVVFRAGARTVRVLESDAQAWAERRRSAS